MWSALTVFDINQKRSYSKGPESLLCKHRWSWSHPFNFVTGAFRAPGIPCPGGNLRGLFKLSDKQKILDNLWNPSIFFIPFCKLEAVIFWSFPDLSSKKEELRGVVPDRFPLSWRLIFVLFSCLHPSAEILKETRESLLNEYSARLSVLISVGSTQPQHRSQRPGLDRACWARSMSSTVQSTVLSVYSGWFRISRGQTFWCQLSATQQLLHVGLLIAFLSTTLTVAWYTWLSKKNQLLKSHRLIIIKCCNEKIFHIKSWITFFGHHMSRKFILM